MSTFSSDTMDQETAVATKCLPDMSSDQDDDINPSMMKSSSYEDIYQDSDLTAEVCAVPDNYDIEVGDRFPPGAAEASPSDEVSHIRSSYENLYLAQETLKESGDVEEKDVDEREKLKRELDEALQHEEKGAAENHKDLLDDTDDKSAKSEEYDAFDINSISCTKAPSDNTIPVDILIESPELSRRPSSNREIGPIDVTLESGLDRVGCEGDDGDDDESPSKEPLSRSSSYHNRTEATLRQSPRQRYYSSPDYQSVQSETTRSSQQMHRGS